ncbi:MAG: DUF2914 domain-containing protein [Candidatus Neomarinimicrobiota bacterium]|nr:DUF2914 domain-containing protein [Candidatus Neomarinimicrobiota bacterium]
MFRPLILDPVVLQITIVIAALLVISLWQKLKVATSIVVAVYSIYMFSFVSANTKVNKSTPIRLAVYKKIVNNVKFKKINHLSIRDETNNTKLKVKSQSSDEYQKTVITPNKLEILMNEPKTRIKEPEVQIANKTLTDLPFKIINMSTGTSVVNRSIVNPKNIFSTEEERIYFLSGVQNKNDSKILYHKWYHEGKLKSKIEMESKRSFNWRSWSYITVNPDRIGDWQVVIEDKSGTRYDSLSFVISDFNI